MKSLLIVASVLMIGLIVPTRAQDSAGKAALIAGTVTDGAGAAVASATVTLEDQSRGRSLNAKTDAQGKFQFSGVETGTYLLRARGAGYVDVDAAEGPFLFDGVKARNFVLRLKAKTVAGGAKPPSANLEYSDEPRFTVAGVSDPSNLGGHGSNITLPTKEALARDMASLRDPNAAVPASEHLRKGDRDEAQGQPLAALHEYQLAAEMEPSEENYLAWGAELLLHRAFEPAAEVFAKGHRLHPQSVEMLMGLGAAAYAQDQTERASDLVLQAIDLEPSDPRPYQFLGRMQEVAKSEPKEWVERFWRFTELQPGNAQAHYFYAVALEKEQRGAADFADRENHLRRTIGLDGGFGDAYLRLGTLYAEKKDYVQSVTVFQMAIAATPLPDEAHFRLAQVYRQMGKVEEAKRETEIYNEVSEKKKAAQAQERQGLGQFVYTLRKGNATAPTVETPKP